MDITSEKGNGYFVHDATTETLDGGWAMDHDEVAVFDLEPYLLKSNVHDWKFSRAGGSAD